jgi:hypothetical protein
MNLQIYTIKDSKAGTYAQPFYNVNHTTAIRAFNASLQDNSNPLSKFPEDFSLYHLGLWDDVKGIITFNANGAEFIANAVLTKEEINA